MGVICHGIFIFRRCIVRHLQYLIFMDSHLCPQWTDLVLVRALRPFNVLVVTDYHIWLLSFRYILLGGFLCPFPQRYTVKHSNPPDLTGIPHKSVVLPCSLGVSLTSVYSESHPGLMSCFVVLSRCLDGVSKQIIILFNSEKFHWCPAFRRIPACGALGAILFPCWNFFFSANLRSFYLQWYQPLLVPLLSYFIG